MRDWQAFVGTLLALPDLTPEREARIVREIAAQLEDFYRDALAHGAAPDVADAYARSQIADWKGLADDVRRADRGHRRPAVDRLVNTLEAQPGRRRGGMLMMAHGFRDARYAIRLLAKAPGFTIVAILTLALGIGATTTIFSVVNGVLLRPLPYPASDRLVRVNEIVPNLGLFSVAPANFIDWRQQNQVFERIAAYTTTSATLTRETGPERMQGMQVSWDIFDLLRVPPILGRGFTADEDRPGAPGVVVISYGAWRQRFGSDPQVVGRSITLSGKPVTIVGVMPAGFYYPTRTPEYWTPLGLNPANATRGGHFLGVVARLKPEITVAQADASMRGMAERLARQYPDFNEGESANVVLVQEQMTGAIRPALLTLFAAVGFVVLIACANVANLLLVRAAAREREIAVRKALGAARARLFAQMLVESLILSVTGGAVGILLAYLALPQILALGADSIPRVLDVTIDRRVLLFTVAASVVTGILFGLVPALQASGAGIGAVLKESGRSSTSAATRWVRSGLLVVEVALSIVLLAGATLLLRSFGKVTQVDPGFQPAHVLAFQVALPKSSYTKDEQMIAFYRSFVDHLEHRGGVLAAGIAQVLPMRGSYVLSFQVRGRPALKPSQQASANYRAISPHYFDALGIRVVRGRGIAEADSDKAQHVAVIDEAFAERHFRDQDPIGQGLQIGNGVDGYFQIVGVAADVHTQGLDEAAAPTMYVPITQDVFSTMWVVVKGPNDPGPLAAVARAALHEVDPTLPVYSVMPMTAILQESLAPRRFSMTLLLLFAAVALFLAGVGLYGVIAYSVTQRTREIGLRIAIGAEPRSIMRLIVGGGMKLALVGMIMGIAGAIALSSVIQMLLFDVKPSDPASYAATSLLLVLVAALACVVPARRAMRVDPVVALRAE